MTKKIRGAEYPLEKIFSSDFDYSIPSYQRPYAWTKVQAYELFSDLSDLFLKVLIKEEEHPNAEVIDGQQWNPTIIEQRQSDLLALLQGKWELA